jgi:myosin heavy subunit
MEKSSQSSFLKSLALAFGDGLLFGVAMKLAQGPSKSREDEMTDLGPLAERLRNVEEHTQTIDKDALVKFGEGLDGRVLEKVIVALEARLTEHVGQVDRRLAEIDAQVALDLKAVDTHTAAQTDAVEKAIQQIEAQVRDYVAAAQQSSTAQIAEVDGKLSALHEGLPAKFREIVEAVRQSMEARVALELTEMESRVASRNVAPERFQELQASLRGAVETLSGRLSAEMRDLAEHQQSQTAPLQQALQQLETKLTTLREELPPKIRQIVEAVEASMDARISTGDQQAADRAAGLEQALAALRAEMPSAGGFQQAVDDSLRSHAEHVGALDRKLTALDARIASGGQQAADRTASLEQALAALRAEIPSAGFFQQAVDDSLRSHAEHVGALDRKLTALQEELPPKIQAIVEAVRQSLDARMAVELRGIEERNTAQEQGLAKVQADVAGIETQFQTNSLQVADRLAGLEQHAAQITAGVAEELEALRAQHRTEIEQLEARLRAERTAENLPAQIDSAVAGLRQSLEAKLATEIHDLEARTAERAPDLEKALQYASLLEARVQALEQKLQQSAEETVNRAVERVWQALESRLQERQAQAPPVVQPPEAISGLRQKSTSAEQSVLDLIAGIGQLFEKPAPRVVHEAASRETQPPVPAQEPVAAAPVAAEPVPPAQVEPEPVVAAHTSPAPQARAPQAPAPEPEAEPEPESSVITMPKPVAKEPAAAVEPAPAPASPAHQEPAAEPVAAAVAVADVVEPALEDKPPVILFKPKDTGRKWRIPFVSSFLLMAAAIAWLEFM